jgi:Uma2 family endonuclease
MALQQSLTMSPSEYLEFERGSTVRHEYVGGRVYAMSGASRWHGLIVSNLVIALGGALRERDCNTIANELRVSAPQHASYFYPDVVVYCGEGEWLDGNFDTLRDPRLVIEVLSPSTERYDRRVKVGSYWTIPSLEAIILVSQDAIRVEHYFRPEGVAHRFALYESLDQTVEIPSLDLVVPVSEIYRRVNFEDQNESDQR